MFWIFGCCMLFLSMFVRKNKNRSGTYSIQIIQKIKGKAKVVKTIGSSSVPQQLEQMESLAWSEINKIKGLGSLFISESDSLIKNTISAISNQQIQVCGPELILGKIYDRIGFNQIEDDTYFRHMVISRLVYPSSKLKTVDYLYRYQNIQTGVETLYRYMDKLHSQHKEKVEHITFEHTKKVLKGRLAIVFYDMTTLYFEASDEDDYRRIGFSKDGKHQQPQIKLGILVGQNGYPIGYDIFEGNKFEGHTLIPVLEQMQKKFNIEKPIVVADAGLLSNKNIKSLINSGYSFILGGRIKNETQQIKDKVQGLDIEESKPVELQKDQHRLIVSFSPKRAGNDAYNRDRGLKRLEQKLKHGKLNKEHINNRGYNKYLKLEGEVIISIDYNKYEADAKWDGLKGYLTNSNLTRQQTIEAYNNLWYVEKAFRISKSDLRTRPIYHRIKKRIEAHICICFTAYAIYKELERLLYEAKAPFSVIRAIDLTKTMYQIQVLLPEANYMETIPLKPDQEQALLKEIVS